MRVLIIGGTRFTGPHIVRQLTGHSHEVAVMHRGQSAASVPEGVVSIVGDRDRIGEHADEIRAFAPDIAVDMMLLNERQAQELLGVLDGVCPRVVAISSCDVYRNYGLLIGIEDGKGTAGRLREDAPLRTKIYPYRSEESTPDDRLYEYDKMLVERSVLGYPSVKGTVLRYPIVYGPGDYQHRFYGYLKRMQDKRSAIVLSEEQAGWRIGRAYCEDCARAVVLAAESEASAGHVYNVAEPESMTEAELVRELARLMDWRGEVVTRPNAVLPEKLRSETRWAYDLDVDSARIRQELEYREVRTREEALRATIEWELANSPDVNLSAEYEAEDAVLGGQGGV